MITLRSAAPSPFARKVRIAIKVLGFEDEITVEAADTLDPADTLRQQNPLGKLPVLVFEDGTTLFDSRVILEYLDQRAGGGRILPGGEARLPALRLQSLADGIMDAGILQIYEARYRPEEKHHQPWLDLQKAKVDRALAALEADVPSLGDPPNVGEIALACALGYLDFRFAGRWRADHPALVAWLERFAEAVPAFAETAPA